MKKAAEACTTIACLAIAAIKSPDDGFPTQLDYAAYWKLSERTAQREWSLFKKAFPGEESPERLARWLPSEYASRLSKREDATVAFSAEAPATLLAPPDRPIIKHSKGDPGWLVASWPSGARALWRRIFVLR